MIINCGGAESEYNDLYKGLKDTLYGQELKIKAGVCHHNTLYYYGICEQIRPNITTRSEMSLDCMLADIYLELNELLNETRPHNYVYHLDITQ